MNDIIHINAGYFQSENKVANKKFSNKRTVSYYEVELFDDEYFYTVINGKKYNLRPNTLIIAKAGEERYSKLHFCCYYIHLSILDEEISHFFDNAKKCILVSNALEYKSIFEKIAKLSLHKVKNYFKIKSELYTLMDMISRDSFLQ